MAESDGYRHTTEYSRTTVVARLRERVRDQERDGVIYGENLSGDRVLAVPSVYWAGGWLMNYLADTYGDEIHLDLLRRPLADVLPTHDTTVGELFDDLVAALAVEPPTAEYAPDVACTGRYRDGQRFAFEVRILNGEDRAATQNLFQQQYRRDASRGWTTHRTWSVMPRGINVSNFSNPLFTGPDSTPFQWRVRACEEQGTNCGRWSNTVKWTAAACARRQ